MRRLMLNCSLISLVSMLGALCSPVAAQSLKVAVFDPSQVFQSTGLGKKVESELNAFIDGKRAEIDGKEKRLRDLQQELQQKALSLSADRRSTMEQDIQRQRLDLQSAQEGAQRALQLESTAAQNAFAEKLMSVVEELGKDESFVLILDRGTVAWASNSIDITTAVVDRFNKMFPAPAD